jgi:hypothetical protein
LEESSLPYKNGTIKLTWINPSDYKILESQMFDSVGQALSNLPKSKGNNWLLFRLEKTDGKKYTWKLLPYGKHRGYVNGMRLRDNPLIRVGIIGLVVLGAINLYKGMLVE